MPTKEVAIYSNFDAKLVDFFALGSTRANNPNGVIQNITGTSASAVTAATIWAQFRESIQAGTSMKFKPCLKNIL
jgi:hypothetical protein